MLIQGLAISGLSFCYLYVKKYKTKMKIRKNSENNKLIYCFPRINIDKIDDNILIKENNLDCLTNYTIDDNKLIASENDLCDDCFYCNVEFRTPNSLPICKKVEHYNWNHDISWIKIN